MNNIKKFWGNAQRIMLQNCENPVNTYLLFYREFTLENPEKELTLRIAGDRDHIVLLDGSEVCRGQFSDDPMVKTHTDIAIKELAAGRHTLLVRCYVCGEKFLSYAPGQPGVILRLFNNNIELVSNSEWRCIQDPAYKNGVMPKLTVQLGFTAQVDLQHAIDYSNINCCNWLPAAAFDLDPAIDYRPRPAAAIPQLAGVKTAQIIKKGVFYRRNLIDMENMTPAELVQSDVIYWESHTPAITPQGALNVTLDYPFYGDIPQGAVILAKLPEEISGFLQFSIEAPAGTVIDLAHGEHIADSRVRARIGARNFADRFICKEGINHFELPFRRIAAMYLELHISMQNHQSVTLHNIGVNSWELPLEASAEFSTADQVLMDLEDRSIRTLKLCMHEHYEDCPWREQALYTYDSRNQMLYGYYLWGNYDYAAASLDLWRGSLQSSGHLNLCAPSRTASVIPIYSFIYPVQLKEHLLYSGDKSCARRNYDIAETIVQSAMQHREKSTGLMIPADLKSWMFYEWVKELSLDGCPEGDLHALFTLYYIEALDAMHELANYLDLPQKNYASLADELRVAVEKHFRDKENGGYFSRTRNGQGFGCKHEHTQMLAVYNQAAVGKNAQMVYDYITNGSSERLTFSSMPYLGLLAARQDGGFFRKMLKERLQSEFAPMLNDSDMGTLYETARGADEFEFAASMCHGWSALPVYYNHAILLGVVPLEPGFKKFRVMPWDGGQEQVSGEVVTPSGKIKVTLQRNGKAFDLCVKHPQELQCVIEELPETPLNSRTIESY